ncbi:MAG: flagellar basal body protein [Rhizomicrobium sp.]
MDFGTSMSIAASGMRSQSERMRTIAENLANANSTSQAAGGDPYRRKIATMNTKFDRELNANMVEAGKPQPDMTDFRKTYDPGNPAADKQGYVKMRT